ncbi:unnamed protein product [Symbiodinium natans]|uniref:Uncharacterized protein n=1 Tax=Symbiodinium natans TaxID=878477 RepID=A0A812I9E8_9DINO|nr:unnamed protein product [Symbiodinium natans]
MAVSNRRLWVAAFLALGYVIVDLILYVLWAMVVWHKSSMLFDILEIIDDTRNPKETLLVLCPSWTLEEVEKLRPLTMVSWGALLFLPAAGFPVFASGVSFMISICVGPDACPNTPTPVSHRLFAFSFFFSGTALLFSGTSFALEWKNDGNPFYGSTNPRSFSGLYYETDCFGYGGCSGHYLDVVAVHDVWCPTGSSPISSSAEILSIVGPILFVVTFPVLVAGMGYACCYSRGPRFCLIVATPSMLAAVCGLVIGGIQYPLVLPYIFAHALWQYARLVINCVAGVDQKAVDVSFRTTQNDDMVPGIIGKPAAGGDGDVGPVEDTGYYGY